MAIAASQTVSATGVSVATLTLTSWTPVANDLILVAVTSRSPTVAHNNVTGNGLTFTKLSEITDPATTNIHASLWWAQGASPTAGSIVVTIASSNAASVCAVATRFSGVSTATPLDGVTVATATGTSTAPTVNVTTVSANAWAFGSFHDRSATFTVGAGETIIASLVSAGTGSNVSCVVTEYQQTVSPATVTINGTWSASQGWCVIGVSLRDAGASTTPTANNSAALAEGASSVSVAVSASDSSTATDTFTALAVAQSRTDSAALTDLSSTLGVAVPTTDSAGMGDASTLDTGSGAQTVSATDSAGLAEGVSAVAQATSDSAALAENRTLAQQFAATDSASLADVNSGLSLPTTDSASLAEGVSAIAQSRTDSASLADTSLLDQGILTVAAADALLLADSSVLSATNAPGASDSALLGNVVTTLTIALSASDVIIQTEGTSALSSPTTGTDSAALAESSALTQFFTAVDAATFTDVSSGITVNTFTFLASSDNLICYEAATVGAASSIQGGISGRVTASSPGAAGTSAGPDATASGAGPGGSATVDVPGA